MPKKSLRVAKAKPKRLRPSKEVSVMAWIHDSHSRVLMVRETSGQKLWTFPGGKVRARESLKDALYRELFEETGFRLKTEAWIEIMDRPARGAIMILYDVKIIGNIPAAGYQPSKEISDVRYWTRLPENASPSAIYFWNKLKPERKK
jgi:ADP-ribose pyrophosphatase YjhB (NUDIX family)